MITIPAFSPVGQLRALAQQPAPLMMTSREIAELTGKRHDHVLRDIRTMLITLYGTKEVDEGIPDKDMFEVFCDRMGWGIAAPKLGNEQIQGVTVVRDQRGFVSEIDLDYTHSMTVVSGYNVKLRKIIIDRWQQLEAQGAAAAPAPAFTIPATFSGALMLAAQQQQQIEQQQAQLALAAPKVEFVDRYVDATGLKGFREVAKMLKANENELRDYLLNSGIMYRLAGVLTAKQPHIDAGRFEVKTGTSEATGHNYNRTLFTPKGVEWISEKWRKHCKGGENT